MAGRKYPYVYPYSRTEAQRLGEQALWEKSLYASIACRGAAEQALRQAGTGMPVSVCVRQLLDAYGFQRMAAVLGSTLHHSENMSFSNENRAWLEQICAKKQGALDAPCAVEGDPVLLNALTDSVRERYLVLDLFHADQCEADAEKLDYTGKVLVLSPDVLKESCWTPRDQLWYAQDGFGCSPDARGRSIFCICLGDGEEARWNRTDFLGPLREEFLPDWAREALERLGFGPAPAMSMDTM